MYSDKQLSIIFLGFTAALLSILATFVVRDHNNRSEIDVLKERLEELMLKESQSVVRVDDRTSSLANTSIDNNAIYRRELNPLPETATGSFTYAANYGVVGDAKTDDTAALQAAIDDAASNEGAGGTVILPKGTFYTTSSLIIPAGITVTGQGYGSSPLAIQFDAGGSVIAYCGTDYAVRIEGHSASLNNLAVYDWRYPVGSDCDNMKAKGGIILDADGKLIESVTMNNVFIYWFMGGTSLTLRSKNNGGIAFNNFQNVRIRHAMRGISLEAEDGSFTK